MPKTKTRRKRHRPCWLRKRLIGQGHQGQCKRYNDCCICAGWKDEGHRS